MPSLSFLEEFCLFLRSPTPAGPALCPAWGADLLCSLGAVRQCCPGAHWAPPLRSPVGQHEQCPGAAQCHAHGKKGWALTVRCDRLKGGGFKISLAFFFFFSLLIKVKTCKPALGHSFAAGTIDGVGAFNFTQGDLGSGFQCGFMHIKRTWSMSHLDSNPSISLENINDTLSHIPQRDALRKVWPYSPVQACLCSLERSWRRLWPCPAGRGALNVERGGRRSASEQPSHLFSLPWCRAGISNRPRKGDGWNPNRWPGMRKGWAIYETSVCQLQQRLCSSNV